MNLKDTFSLNTIFIAMTLVLFSSCSKDDGPSSVIDETNLVGTWLFKSLDAGDDATSALWIKELDAEGSRLAFKRDGTYFVVGYLDLGTWKFENNTLILDKGTEDAESFEIRELSPTTLVVHALGGGDSDGDTFPAIAYTYSNISKDDPVPLIDETNLLVGTWLFKSADAGDAVETASLNNLLEGMQWTIKRDVTYIFASPDGDEDRGTWMLENNTLTLDKGTEGEEIFEIRELSPTTLSIDDHDDAIQVITYTFSKQ